MKSFEYVQTWYSSESFPLSTKLDQTERHLQSAFSMNSWSFWSPARGGVS